MLKRKTAKTIALAVCLTLASTGAVLASEGAKVDLEDKDRGVLSVESIQLAPDTPVSNVVEPAPQISKEIYNLQVEIDQYLFKQYPNDIRDKGFTVTHTLPWEDYVEIGIEPYSEENAEYLYSLFGKDKIKVVEGEKAILYDLAVSNDGGGIDPGLAPDASVREPGEMMTTDMEIDPAAQDMDIAVDANLVSAQDGAEESAETSSDNGLYYAVAGAVAIGAGAFGARKLLTKKK